MGAEVQYTPLTTEEGTPLEPLTEAELRQVKKSRRWVMFLCVIHLIMAFLTLLMGGLIQMIISAIFISCGIVGVAKQRPRLLCVHFVYSVLVYILSLIGFVLMVLYCDENCQWWFCVVGFFGVLFQAIGMRHSRMLIGLLKKQQGISCCRSRCKRETACDNKTPVAENTTPVAQQFPQVVPQNVQMYPIPSHQFVPMEVQPRLPQYFPLQPLHYPMMQQAQAVPLNNQQQPGVGFYPVMYKQI